MGRVLSLSGIVRLPDRPPLEDLDNVNHWFLEFRHVLIALIVFGSWSHGERNWSRIGGNRLVRFYLECIFKQVTFTWLFSETIQVVH
jgi:hypothetical protein